MVVHCDTLPLTNAMNFIYSQQSDSVLYRAASLRLSNQTSTVHCLEQFQVTSTLKKWQATNDRLLNWTD